MRSDRRKRKVEGEKGKRERGGLEVSNYRSSGSHTHTHTHVLLKAGGNA